MSKQAILAQLKGAVHAAARRNYRKEQRSLAGEGIAADIRVPYTQGGDAALGAASAGRQLAAALLQNPEHIPYVRAKLDMSTVVLPEIQQFSAAPTSNCLSTSPRCSSFWTKKPFSKLCWHRRKTTTTG